MRMLKWKDRLVLSGLVKIRTKCMDNSVTVILGYYL